MNNNFGIIELTSTFPRWKDDTDPSFVFELAQNLYHAGIEVHVLAPAYPGSKENETMSGIKVTRYRYFLEKYQKLAYANGILSNLKNNRFNYLLVFPFFLFQLIALLRIIRKGNDDCIHAHWLIPQGIIAVLAKIISGKKSLKILCTSHGGDLFALNNYLFNKIKLWVINNSDHTTVVSNYMYEYCKALGIDSEKISVQPMGVDLKQQFYPKNNLRQNDLLFVGRLVEKKGVYCLLHAIGKLVRKYPNIKTIIVGDGPLRGQLEEMAKQLKIDSNLIFKGALPKADLPDIYNDSKIFVLPSIIAVDGDQEGLGLVMVEALGCGCAVVASSLGAVRDVIDDGVNGCLFIPGNVDDLVEKVDILFSNPEKLEQISKQGRDISMEKFDWSVVGDAYRLLIIDLIRK